MTLGIVMNVYNETDTLRNALMSIQNVGYDELHIAVSSDNLETWNICRAYTDNVYKASDKCFYINKEGKRRYSFGDGRQFIREQCHTDWIMYIDADDILVGGEKIRPFLEEHNDCNSVNMNYHFAFADKEMTRPRCIVTAQRITKMGNWEGHMHERFHWFHPSIFIPDVYMKHDHEHNRKEKVIRNLEDCIEEYEINKDDIRLYNLAQAHHDADKNDEALKLYKKYLSLPDIDSWYRYKVLMACGDIYTGRKEYKFALNQYNRASRIFPEDALWVFRTALIYCLKGDYIKAIELYTKGFSMKQPKSAIVYFNPEEYNYQPAINFYNCLYLTGRTMYAYMLVGELLLKYPEDKTLLKLKENLWAKHGKEFAEGAGKLLEQQAVLTP